MRLAAAVVAGEEEVEEVKEKELERGREASKVGPAAPRPSVAGALAHWRRDRDLDGVRDPEVRSALDDAERDARAASWGVVAQVAASIEPGTTTRVGP